MCNDKLYKYLDASGGSAMLYNSTLMFTNATQLNDPFDCHPLYVHFSREMPTPYKGWPPETVSELEYNKGLQRRDKTYICSLSKVYDSILMWSYYNQHQGICIGLDMEKTRKCLNRMMGLFYGCPELEVQYRDVIKEPCSIKGPNDFLCNLFATKAKDWQHEQEVRLIAYDPSPMYMRLLPGQYEEDPSFCTKLTRIFQKKMDETSMDWKDVRAFLDIGGECFESVYLGVNLNKKKNAESREKIIKAARKCNPDIKIYQMTIDPEAFRMKHEPVGF
ncbi:MAG: DUF2971 domain-containing protein [Bacteroidales bacterium]|nr:DUF2971 domain-containing protein [Bacteroidales bacterium]